MSEVPLAHGERGEGSDGCGRGRGEREHGCRVGVDAEERIFIERMTSDRKLKASREGLNGWICGTYDTGHFPGY